MITTQGNTYTLIFQNNSINTWTAAVYQQAPDIGVQNVQSLAWFAQQAAPTTQLVFSWTIDYEFVWSETATLKPGVVFTASQKWATDPSGGNNQVTFSDVPPFTFTEQTSGPAAGSLYIVQDRTIPLNTASVGIAMGGASAYAVQAEPNITTSFTPTPNYWITFGQYIPGEVIDVQEIASTSAQIAFPPNVFSMTAILSEQNQWTVQPTQQVNAADLAAKAQDPNIKWGRAI